MGIYQPCREKGWLATREEFPVPVHSNLMRNTGNSELLPRGRSSPWVEVHGNLMRNSGGSYPFS
jgi:hypothetical protein